MLNINDISQNSAPIQFYIGVSSNHKRVGNNHNSLRFKNHWLTIDEVIENIKDNCFFCSPVDNPPKQNSIGYTVQKAIFFEKSYILPFDFDFMQCTMEDFIGKLPPKLYPTIYFKTRNNNDIIGTFKYRFLYFFNNPFTSRVEYYSFYECIKNEICSYTKDVGEDDFAYGLDPQGKGKDGNCCKPIRTNASDEIYCSGQIYCKEDFFAPIIFNDLNYESCLKINRALFSDTLLDLILKYRKYGLSRYFPWQATALTT